nr:PREDICTED: latent-transforming growth factor beta-binding protein 4 [Lepisosteus oculatus]
MVLLGLLPLLYFSVVFPHPADAQSAGGERIKVLFTPTICKVRCTQGHCTNFCERGNITTLYSTNHGRPEPGSGFRVFLCPLLCQNGGVCIQKDRCLCPPTFTGKFCHIPVRSSTNEIRKLPPAAALSSNQQRLTESEYTLPLQNHQSLQSGGSSLVKVRVQHPPEASVKIHQVLRVRGVQEEAEEQQADTGVGTGGLSGRRHSLLPGERAEAPPPRVQAQTVRGDPSYTESSGFKYCFGEVRNGQCSSPLPGLRSQETCCRGAGLAWGITECILCSTLSGSGGSGDRSCPQGFERRNGTQCVDINECSQPGFCVNGDCVNTRGSYSCVCKQGYILDASHGICISQKVISEDKGQCYRLLTSGICSLPILRNITKQICCCSRVGKGWGRSCERCPPFGSADFKEICPAGPGYHYSASTVKLNPRLVNLQGGGASLDSQIIAELQFGGVPTAQPTRGPTRESQNSPSSMPGVLEPDCRKTTRPEIRDGFATSQPLQNGAHTDTFVSLSSVFICIRPCRNQVTQKAVLGGGMHYISMQYVNECENPLICPGQECVNSAGSFQCIPCRQGYRLQNGRCTGFIPWPDVDECARPGLCQDGRCTNTEGSFECQCLTGFTTNPERTACLDVDECAESRGAVCRNQRCENTIGSFHCITICEPGYRVTASGDCVDINECANNTICGEHAFCQNLMGSYQCMCDPGYETAEDGRRCMDVNECESMPGVCGAARCENVEGTFLCNCRNEQDEYDPQTRQCVSRPAAEPRVIPINAGGALVPDSRPQRSDAQECYYNTGDTRMCSTLSRNTTRQECCCTIGEGWGLGCSFTPCPAPGTEEFQALCPRGQGYVTTGLGSFSYQDVDECKIFHPEICKNGVCSNNIPGFNCYCFSGYYYDSTLLECIDNNECDNEEACKDGQCINTEGSYYCTCQAPLVLDDTQMSCINTTSEDLDENLAYCWQELTLDLVCQRPLPERQVTFTECCCLYGEAWGLKCALCPGRDTEAYETMCNTLRPPAYGPSFGGRYRPMLGGDYGAPYGPNIFAEPPPRPGGPDFLIPGYEDYSPLADRGTSSRRRPPYGLREGPYGRRGPNRRYEIGEYEPQYVPPEPDPESRYGIPNPLSEPAYELLPRQGVGSLPAAPPFDQGEPRPPEPWLRYRPREGPPFPERGAAGGTRRELYDSRYEPHEGFQAEECGILHGCDNGRCIRVSEGYTCDCYDGYQLDMTNMACIDVNECEEEGDPGTLCVNGQCVNTDGSYECVCLRGFVVSRQPHYCVPAPPLQ